MRVEISIEQLERVEKILHGIPGAVEKVEANAFNRGLETAKAEGKRQIRQRYAISTGNLAKYERIKISRATSGGAEASISFEGPKIPLFRFQPTPKSRAYENERILVMTHKAVGEKPAQFLQVYRSAKQSAMDIKEKGQVNRPVGFIATFQSGHTGIFKRTSGVTSSGREKLEEYWGPAVADMLDYEPAREAIEEKTADTINKRLEHEMGRVLENY